MSDPVLDALSNEKRFYFAMHKLAELAWEQNMTVEALLTLTELLVPDRPSPPKPATEPGS